MKDILKIIDSNKKILAYLNNLESGTVKQVVNREYVLSFVALIEPLKTEFLYNENNLIEYNNDYFRVINIDEEHDSNNMLKVYVNCEHISYDLIKQTKLTYDQENRSAIYVMNDLLLSSGFQFLGTDVTTTNSIEVKQEIDIKSLLFMVTQIWGGELKYFQNTIELKQQLGLNRGTDFRWGKNLNNLRRYIDFVDNTVVYEVEVIQGVLPEEFKGLEQFYLGDTIKVADEALNIEIDTRIVELETDIITGLNSRIVLGQPIKDLASGFSNIFNSIKNLNFKIDNKTIELNNTIESVVEDINAVVDGQIITYYQDTEPTGKFGDLWFNTLTKKLYRYGTTWELVEDKDITTAIDKAQNAQDTADGKIVSFYQETEPTNARSGDLWFNTINGKMYRYNGTNFNLIEDGSISEIYTNIDTIQTSIDDGMIVTYYQDTPPTGKHGDLWFNTATKKLYIFTTLWVLIEDKDITTAIESAQNAQDTADGKIVSFYQDAIPTTANSGDLWIDTNDGNKLYRYNGTGWVSARDGSLAKIDNVIDANGKLIAEKLSGNLNTAITKVQNSTGKTTFDDRGLIVHDQPVESASIKAMLLTANGLLIANAKNTDGTWRWRTAITADGISADEITTGTLSAININGVNITGSTIKSDNANAEIKLEAGVLSIKDKASTAQFNQNYRAGLPNKILQSELEYYNEFKTTNPNKPANNTISLNSNNSHMGLEFGNGAVSLGNNWVNFAMYGGTFDWAKQFPNWVNNSDYTPPPANAQGSKLVIDCATTVWDVIKDYPGLAIAYSSSCDVNIGLVDFAGNVEVRHNFKVRGTKNCTIDTKKFGELDFSAYETAEIYLGDIGESKIINGECIINLDKKLLACVNTDIPYQVFLTPYSNGQIYVAERNKTSFVVKGDNIPFGYEVKIKRKNYENIRFGQVV